MVCIELRPPAGISVTSDTLIEISIFIEILQNTFVSLNPQIYWSHRNVFTRTVGEFNDYPQHTD